MTNRNGEKIGWIGGWLGDRASFPAMLPDFILG
jgi:hypothetical protein